MSRTMFRRVHTGQILVVLSLFLLAAPILLSHSIFILSSVGPNVSTTSGLSSWNPNVSCTPLVVTVEQVVGNQTSALGGATENGSIFNPGITSPYGPDNTKRWLTPSASAPSGWVAPGPPCTITNANGQVVSAFVQINGVQRGFRAEEDWNSSFMPINGGTHYSTAPQSDTTFNVLSPGYGPCTSTNTTSCMHALHAEIDHDWKGAGYCGLNTACDNSTLVNETGAYNSLIDVQGFVSWDPDHLNEATHNFSGWELHPLTAWRLSGVSSDFSLSANPSPLPVSAGLSATSTITINTFNLFSGNVSFSVIITPWLTAGGQTPTVMIAPPSVNVQPGASGSSILNVTAAQSSTGNYTVAVIGTNGTLVRSVSLTSYVTDFSIVSVPTSMSLSLGSSGTSDLTLASINGFSGVVSLTATVSPASLTAGLSPSPPTASLSSALISLAPQGGGSSILTVSTSLLTTPGSYTVTVTGTSGGLSHTLTIQVTVTVAGLV